MVLPVGTKYIPKNQDYMSIPLEPYEIAYRALTPLYRQCANLLVPVGMSATPVAYGSHRVEPQYMLMGHAAGVAAAMAAKSDTAVQKVEIRALQSKLRSQGQILSTEYKSPVTHLKRL